MIMNKLRQFMYGRYGSDQLNMALTVLMFIVAIVSRFFSGTVVTIVFSVVIWGIFALIFYRMFSKKIYVRRKENENFMNFFGKIKKWFSFQKRRFQDRKTYKYAKCPSCKAQLRFPNKKGSHTVRCPKCGSNFDVKI